MTETPEPGQAAYEANAKQFDIHPFFARAAAWSDLPADTKAHYASVEKAVVENWSTNTVAGKLAAIALEKLGLIDRLRAGEGWAVTIVADNADFDGPNSIIEVTADWTNWEPKRFPGESVLHCLRTAWAAMPGDA
jgi:hypothetical protein